MYSDHYMTAVMSKVAKFWLFLCGVFQALRSCVRSLTLTVIDCLILRAQVRSSSPED